MRFATLSTSCVHCLLYRERHANGMLKAPTRDGLRWPQPANSSNALRAVAAGGGEVGELHATESVDR